MPTENAIDHLAEEFERMEHVNPWARAFRWAAGILIIAGVIGSIVWMLTVPPTATSAPARASYIPSDISSVDVVEPTFGRTLEGGPVRFEWETVAGRLQYIVRVYEKGATNPVLERATTATSFELAPEERAKFEKGTAYVWTVIAQNKNGSAMAAGQSTFKVR